MSHIKAFFSAMGAFFGWLNNKQLMDAGEDRGNAKHNQKALEDVKKANDAIASISNPIERKRVRDKFSRD